MSHHYFFFVVPVLHNLKTKILIAKEEDIQLTKDIKEVSLMVLILGTLIPTFTSYFTMLHFWILISRLI